MPLAANSGQYSADRRVDVELAPVDQHQRGQAVTVFVVDQTLMIVSSVHGRRALASSR